MRVHILKKSGKFARLNAGVDMSQAAVRRITFYLLLALTLSVALTGSV